MEEEKQESGISLGNILHVIFSQKWLALIILVAVTLAGTLGIYYGKNKSSETYDVSFIIELPRTEAKDNKQTEDASNKSSSSSFSSSSASVIYYPDGTPFYYTDIVSLPKLRAVKNSNPEFENINIEKMSKSGDIFISRSVSETATNSTIYESIYNLNVKASYFPDKDVARSFVVALINTPIEYLRTMNINYNVYTDLAKDAPDYITEISQLTDQCNYLIERYDTFAEIYSDLSVDGKTLRAYSQEIKSYLNDKLVLDILQTEVKKKCFIKSEDSIAIYEHEYDILEDSYKTAYFTLENLKLMAESGSISAEVFKNQSDLVIGLKKQMDEIKVADENGNAVGGFLASTDFSSAPSPEHEKFIAELDKAYEQVQSYTERFNEVVSSLYSKVSAISYSNSNIVVSGGVTGLVMSLIISLVAGIVLAMIVAFTVGYVKTKKQENLTVAVAEPDSPEQETE